MGVNLWVFSILAKLVYTGQSVETLIRSGRTRDAKPLVRGMFESLVDVNYILKGPKSRNKLCELAELELAVDEYAELRFECKRCGITIDQAVKKNPTLKATEDRYRKAKQHDAFQSRPEGVSAKDRPKPWSKIRRQEKQKFLKLSDDASLLLAHTITHLGDAAVHSRFAALKDFVARNKDGTLRILNKPRNSYLYCEEWVALEATLSILLACDVIAYVYHTDEVSGKNIKRILGRMQEAVKTRSSQPSSHVGRARPAVL